MAHAPVYAVTTVPVVLPLGALACPLPGAGGLPRAPLDDASCASGRPRTTDPGPVVAPRTALRYGPSPPFLGLRSSAARPKSRNATARARAGAARGWSTGFDEAMVRMYKEEFDRMVAEIARDAKSASELGIAGTSELREIVIEK